MAKKRKRVARTKKWEIINYRQQKAAEQARALLRLPAIQAKVGAVVKAYNVCKFNEACAVNKKVKKGLFWQWQMDLLNNFISKKKVEVAIAADNSNVVQKGGPFSSHYTFIAKLEKRGYKHLGSGNFSSVYGRDNSAKVLKITHNLSDSWFYYAKWANENGWGGKYAPKMYSHKFFKTNQGGFAVAVMERLKPKHDPVFNKGPYEVVELLSRYQENPTALTLLDLVAPGLPKFMEDAKKRFRFDDDHGQNLMVRDDGTLVWNDPVAWGAERTANDNIQTRLRAKDLAPVALAA